MAIGGPGGGVEAGAGGVRRPARGGAGAKAVGAGGDGADAGGAIFADINITPLTDIFLVLLIIFMVTSSVIAQQGLSVNLPSASAQSSTAQPEGVIVTLEPGGRVRVNGEAVPWSDSTAGRERPPAFREAVAKAFLAAKSRLVILEGDEKAFLGNAVGIMDEARKAGAERFAIATKPSN